MKTFVTKKFGEVLGDEKAIHRIDIVKRHDNNADRDYVSLYIHIAFWPDNKNSKKLQNKLENDKEIKIFYDSKFYWKCVRSKLEMPTFEDEKKFGKAYIADSDDDSDEE